MSSSWVNSIAAIAGFILGDRFLAVLKNRYWRAIALRFNPCQDL
ncbi:hypothetical protein [Almyronema epifaneia]|uniref:Uncharacterized protein n=1 Tax=Almyronema epifaneia S1 TaxID=2991925 RepID=A0ABW6IBM1_9CYAN